MQLADPDPNVLVEHAFIAWYIDPYGTVLNERYKLEILEEIQKQLIFYRYSEVIKRCPKLSVNFERKKNPSELCDISLHLPEILDNLDLSLSPYLQQQKVEEEIQKQIESNTKPQVQGYVRYSCELQESRNSISMHMKGIKIINVLFIVENQTFLSNHISYESEREIVQFWFDIPLPAKRKGQLIIEFQYEIASHWCGLYVVNPFNLPSPKDIRDYDQEMQKHHLDLLKLNRARIVATQFESTGARRAFPCYDTPTRKIRYTIRVISVADIDVCVSNCPLKLFRGMSSGNGLQLWEFTRTPPLPTYLLAVVLATKDIYVSLQREIQLPLCDDSPRSSECPKELFFRPPSSKKTKTIKLRLLIPKEKREEGEQLLPIAVEIFRLLWDYFRIPLPLKKLDSISLPWLRPGAMENFGCMTFRENELVPSELSFSGFNSVEKLYQAISSAKIWAHEAAHQWTGNLVTAKDWNQLWINEGFATYLSFLIVDKLKPEWNVWGRYLANDLKTLQEEDWISWNPELSQLCSPKFEEESCWSVYPFPRNRTVVAIPALFRTMDYIETVFDRITYGKGSFLLRSLEALYGSDNFQYLLHKFFLDHRLRWASFDEFRESLLHSCPQCLVENKRPVLISSERTNEIKVNLERKQNIEIIQDYFLIPGFPIVFVTLDINLHRVTFRTHTNKNLKMMAPAGHDLGKGTWYIPLFNGEANAKDFNQSIVLGPENTRTVISFRSASHLLENFKINRNGLGYFLTVYDESGYEQLGRLVRDNQYLSMLDKIHLLTDIFFALRRKLIPFQICAQFLTSFRFERDPTVLIALLNTFREIIMFFKFIPKLRLYCQTIAKHIFDQIIDSGETDSRIIRAIHSQAKIWLKEGGQSLAIPISLPITVSPSPRNELKQFFEEGAKEIDIDIQIMSTESAESIPSRDLLTPVESALPLFPKRLVNVDPKQLPESVNASVDVLLQSLVRFFETNPKILANYNGPSEKRKKRK